MSEDDVRISVLEERVNQWMSTTIDYRKQLCDKIDDIRTSVRTITEKFEDLPCKERKGWYGNMASQVRWLWGAVGASVLLFIGAFISHLFK